MGAHTRRTQQSSGLGEFCYYTTRRLQHHMFMLVLRKQCPLPCTELASGQELDTKDTCHMDAKLGGNWLAVSCKQAH